MINLLRDGQGDYVIKTSLSQKFTINGRTKAYPVYRVRLDKLFYNDQNDRIATWISQYKSEHGAEAFSALDREEYNEIIEGFIVQSNEAAIEKTRNNIALVQQRQPGVILADGRVIDGNRRFTCLRQLSKTDSEFNWFETVILDTTIESDKKQIKMLELAIQHGEEQKVDYNHIDRLVGVYQDIVETQLLTVEEYASSTNESVAEVKKKVEYALLLVDFLEFIHMPKQYHVARDYQIYSIIVELLPILRKCSTPEMQQKVKNAVFTNVMMHSIVDGRKYMRNLSSMMDSGFFMTYMREQERIGEDLREELEGEAFSSKKELDAFVREHEETTEDLQTSLDKTVLKAKKHETRNKPSQIVSKSITMLRDVDTNIFEKLTDLEKENLRGQLDRLTTIVSGFDSMIDTDSDSQDVPKSTNRTVSTVVRKVETKDEPHRFFIAKHHNDEPYIQCLSIGRAITNLNVSIELFAHRNNNGASNVTYKAFFVDGNNEMLSEVKDVLLHSGQSTKVLFTLMSKASQMEQCFFALKSVKDKDDELQQLIPFDIKISFVAEFDF